MTPRQHVVLALCFAGGIACAGPTRTNRPEAPAATAGTAPLPDETHFGDLRQLTFGGENAEAYWSWSGRELVLQAKLEGQECDRIYRLPVADGAKLLPVSDGTGATTCSYFMPGDQDIIYASTHLGGAACPPKPDHSQGYVWALYDSYDIFKVRADGSGAPVRLTDAKGYDAEATVCGKDGSIVFTSVRDGDLELYRMDADGGNVRRLTHTPGYDGGAFFNRDCSRLVWRASRPRTQQELDEYKALLARGLVRPSKLELYVGNADGTDATQITYLDAASFAPYWHPSQRRILFSSNYGDPRGREFDIWAVDDSGARLERITRTPGFDGFPMFSPDGTLLAFASNRATAPGRHDTNVFVTRWVDGAPPRTIDGPADRVLADIRHLADPALEGRGVGTAGLDAAGAYVEGRFSALGLTPLPGGFRQAFPVVASLAAKPATAVELDGRRLASDAFVPLGFSPLSKAARGPLVFADYGVVAKELGRDDYARVDAKGKIVVVRRFVPSTPQFQSTDAKRRYGDLRYKAWLARERGAVALLVVDEPAEAGAAAPAEARLPELAPEGYGDSGIPSFVVRRSGLKAALDKLRRGQRVQGSVVSELEPVSKPAFNVVGRIPAGAAEKLPGTIVIGAHYDHLGFGGRHSLAPGDTSPHVGADDNASGTAALLEIARELVAARASLRRDVVIAAFSAEESGALGSAHFVRQAEQGGPGLPRPAETYAMLNLDMVGRLRDNRLTVLGTETAAEWPALVQPACDATRVGCTLTGDGGYGPSDQMSFYVAGVPVLHFFTGAHSDYHKPTDTIDKINAAGAGQIAKLISSLTRDLAAREAPLAYKSGAHAPAPRGDLRNFGASLGTIPDYAGPGPGKSGVLLGGVRPGGAAEQAGLRRGDVLIRLRGHEIRGIEDLMYVLGSARPGERAAATVLRDGKPLEVNVVFQESQGRR